MTERFHGVRWMAAAAAATVLVVATAVAGSGGTAGACSFAGPALDVPREVRAGGTLHVAGQHWSRIEGEVGAMCDGDYQQVPLDGLEVEVAFATLSGDRSLTVPAAVHADFTFGPIPIPVPVDATEAVVTVVDPLAVAPTRALVIVLGASPTTTATPQTPPSAPAPADPVTGDAGFTG